MYYESLYRERFIEVRLHGGEGRPSAAAAAAADRRGERVSVCRGGRAASGRWEQRGLGESFKRLEISIAISLFFSFCFLRASVF
jgi:hypothetical protein